MTPAKKLENIDPDQLPCEDSVERCKQFIIDAYEPIEDFRTGKVMDHFPGCVRTQKEPGSRRLYHRLGKRAC